MRVGLNTTFDSTVPLATDAAPPRLSLQLALPRTPTTAKGQPGGGLHLPDFFDTGGLSLVAGRAALVPGGDAPQQVAVAAANAGAAGGRALRGPSASGRARPRRSLGRAGRGRAGGRGPCARHGASRRAHRAGLDRVRPDRRGRRRRRAVLVAWPDLRRAPQARPGCAGCRAQRAGAGGDRGLDRPLRRDQRRERRDGGRRRCRRPAGPGAAGPGRDGLRGALVGTARPLRNEPPTAEGAGQLDLGAAAAAELAADPTTIAFHRTEPRDWREAQRLSVRNISTRPLSVTAGVVVDGDPKGVRVAPYPRAFILRPGKSGTVLVQGAPAGSTRS